MDENTFKQLREAFPEGKIGKLPKLTCGACRESRNKQCDQHRKQTCSTCGNWISTSHIHIDYVGHADITDRFLNVDPEWNWEPVARDVDPEMLRAAIATGNADIVRMVLDAAPPKLDSNGGMWMRLTIAGVTRLGYGDGGGKRGADAVKVAIGDGLRNGGMRFGAGLDMWRKETEASDASSAPQPPAEQRTNPRWLASIKKRIAEASTAGELRGLAAEIDTRVQGGFCEQAHYDELWQLGTARMQEVEQAEAEQPAAPPPGPRPSPAPAANATGEEPSLADQFSARLEAAEALDTLVTLKDEVMDAFKSQRLNPTEGNALLRAIKNRQHDVGTSAA